MLNQSSVAGHWSGDFDELRLKKWAEKIRCQLAAPRVSLGLVFMSPRYYPNAPQVLEILRVHAEVPALIGCSSSGLIAGGQEIEENAGLVLGLFALPGADLTTFRFTPRQVEEVPGQSSWNVAAGLKSDQTNGWLVFADPFSFDADRWMKGWNDAFPHRPALGGLASGKPGEQRTQLYLNGDTFEDGGVAVSFGGEVTIHGVISQGCTPIGETWTITKADQNIIQEIGNRPAYEVLLETFNRLSPAEQKSARGNLFIGLVVNEYLDEFHRGDFLIRNLIGADPKSGCLAVGAIPRVGQTLQFQRRDARAATEDMIALLDRSQNQLAGATVYGACLCCCNGRGFRLFGYPNHDAGVIQTRLGPLGLAGFFCNGEIGPVGDRNFLHGYTASLALFMRK